MIGTLKAPFVKKLYSLEPALHAVTRRQHSWARQHPLKPFSSSFWSREEFRTSCSSSFSFSSEIAALLLRPALGKWSSSIYVSSSFRWSPKQNTGRSEKTITVYTKFVLGSHEGRDHVAPRLAQGPPWISGSQIGRSGSGPENLHFSLVPRWFWCCCPWHHIWESLHWIKVMNERKEKKDGGREGGRKEERKRKKSV